MKGSNVNFRYIRWLNNFTLINWRKTYLEEVDWLMATMKIKRKFDIFFKNDGDGHYPKYKNTDC